MCWKLWRLDMLLTPCLRKSSMWKLSYIEMGSWDESGRWNRDDR